MAVAAVMAVAVLMAVGAVAAVALVAAWFALPLFVQASAVVLYVYPLAQHFPTAVGAVSPLGHQNPEP
jgi:hypothetical protein